MPRVQTRRRRKSQVEPCFPFREAVATEVLRTGFIAEIAKGTVLPKDHQLVRDYPQFFRAIGPRVDEIKEVSDGE
jgi:hypothetical protein